MKTADYGRIRKLQACHDRGHNFKRISSKTEGVRSYKCKCGAVALSTENALIVQPAPIPMKEI